MSKAADYVEAFEVFWGNKKRRNLMEKHICESCGAEGEVHSSENPNFVCPVCGYEKNLLLRREMVDLHDPVEGALAMQIFAGARGWEKTDGK